MIREETQRVSGHLRGLDVSGGYWNALLRSRKFGPDHQRRPRVSGCDAINGLIYVTEAGVGDDGETVVHVWKIDGELIFRDGFEGGGSTNAWSSSNP